MGRPRVLFLAQVPPNPPDSGPKVRNHQVLLELVSFCDVTLLTFVRGPDERSAGRALSALGVEVVTVPLRRSPVADLWHALLATFGDVPFLVRRDARTVMRKAVRSLLASGRADLLHVDQLPMAQYMDEADRAGVRAVLDEHNVVHLLFPGLAAGASWLPGAGWWARREGRKLREFERRACSRAAAVMTVSEDDRASLQRLLGGAAPAVACVPIAARPLAARAAAPAGPPALLCLGTMFYPPNADGAAWFIRHVHPLVRARLAGARLTVVGARAPRRLRALAARDPTVTVSGYLPDLAAVVAGSAALVVPLRSGGGVRVKILEAFATGLPVVSTSVGCAGLDVVPGRELLVADEPDDLAAAIVRVVTDPACRDGLVRRARAYVEERHAGGDVGRALRGLYAAAGVVA